MAELKTKPTTQNVVDFLNSIEDEAKRKDCFSLLEIFTEITGDQPKMWGEAIVGFGDYHYKYASGRDGDWFIAGFSPRKQNLTLYTLMYNAENQEGYLEKLGKYKRGKGCLYINKLSDIDTNILKEIIKLAVKNHG